MTSATKAELAVLYIMERKRLHTDYTQRNGTQTPPTPFDNSMTEAGINGKLTPKRSVAQERDSESGMTVVNFISYNTLVYIMFQSLHACVRLPLHCT
jgi:hypothetical protein